MAQNAIQQLPERYQETLTGLVRGLKERNVEGDLQAKGCLDSDGKLSAEIVIREGGCGHRDLTLLIVYHCEKNSSYRVNVCPKAVPEVDSVFRSVPAFHQHQKAKEIAGFIEETLQKCDGEKVNVQFGHVHSLPSPGITPAAQTSRD
ncbi:Uncharacterised protein [uncultured archaeon]|nr:Uncharacterised protein [uncultured archaeon]